MEELMLESGILENEIKIYLVVWLVAHGYGKTPTDELVKKYLDYFIVYRANEKLLDSELLEFMKHMELFVQLGMHLKKEVK